MKFRYMILLVIFIVHVVVVSGLFASMHFDAGWHVNGALFVIPALIALLTFRLLSPKSPKPAITMVLVAAVLTGINILIIPFFTLQEHDVAFLIEDDRIVEICKEERVVRNARDPLLTIAPFSMEEETFKITISNGKKLYSMEIRHRPIGIAKKVGDTVDTSEICIKKRLEDKFEYWDPKGGKKGMLALINSAYIDPESKLALSYELLSVETDIPQVIYYQGYWK